MSVSTTEDADPMKALNRGYYITAALVSVAIFVACKWLLVTPDAPNAWLHYFGCAMIGVVTSIAFVFITQYYTEYRYRPVLSIAEASQTGPATNIIMGLSVGMESTVLPVFTIAAALVGSFMLGRSSGIMIDGEPSGGLFGTAVATMGMLGTAGYILAMDVFGPITDNAGGIVEMSKQPESIRDKTDRLDAVGNTTKALTKGYAIGSAALAAFLLFSAYLDEVKNYTGNALHVDLSKPQVFVSALHRRHAGVLVLVAGHDRRLQGGAERHHRSAPPVQGTSRHHGGHRGARLREVRGHRDDRRAEGDGAARLPGARVSRSASD